MGGEERSAHSGYLWVKVSVGRSGLHGREIETEKLVLAASIKSSV